MVFSDHNVFGSFPGGKQGFIVNLLSGQADLLELESLDVLRSGCVPEFCAEWVAKGYVVDSKEEERRFRAAYLDFLDERERDEVQIFFVPWYVCNFSCSYCFQEQYEWESSLLKDEVIDAFFETVKKRFAGRRKYLTLFGGEPLLGGEAHRRVVSAFLDRATAAGLDTAVVTNGYLLDEYVSLLSQHRIR